MGRVTGADSSQTFRAVAAAPFDDAPLARVSTPGVRTIEVKWEGGRPVEQPGTEKVWEADLIMLSMGFLAELFTAYYGRHSEGYSIKAWSPPRKSSPSQGAEPLKDPQP